MPLPEAWVRQAELERLEAEVARKDAEMESLRRMRGHLAERLMELKLANVVYGKECRWRASCSS